MENHSDDFGLPEDYVTPPGDPPPCRQCGGNQYEWGHLQAHGYPVVFQTETTFTQRVFGADHGRRVQSRRCRQCGNILIFGN